MSAQTLTQNQAAAPPLSLERWRGLPNILIGAGGLLALIGLIADARQFAFSYLLAFMFYLSIVLGSMFLVMVHHLFDAGWSVPMRRFLEHLAALSRIMAPLFLPVLLLAPKLYGWMTMDPPDHALHVKQAVLNRPMWILFSILIFAAWIFWSHKLRFWSLQQDKTGAALCTYRMRFFSASGIFVFAITLTLAAILWMKSLQHQWFSTMYGVYYFAGSVWLTLATAYVITVILDRVGHLHALLCEHQYYYTGSLFFAFTVFYAYIHFSQYFIIWNGNVPEETWWYVVREKGSWWDIGLLLIFGHFFLPFLALLRIDVKSTLPIMLPLCAWAWIMHFCDLSFNIIPVLHPDGFVLHWMDLACMVFIGGVLAKVFLMWLNRHPVYPQKDPRLIEAVGLCHPIPTPISGGELDETDETLTDHPSREEEASS